MEVLKTRVTQAAPARSRDERALIEARNAVQWLARVARSYAPAAAQDTTQNTAHDRAQDISLDFDPSSRRVITPEIAPGIRLGLHLPSLVFQFEDDGTPTPHALDVDDKSTTEVEAWLLAELLHRGFDRHCFDKRLPYEWPHPMSGDEIKYTAHDLADELDRLTHRLATAAAGLIEARHKLEEKDGAEPSDRELIPFFPDLFNIGLSRSSSAPLT